MLPFFQSDGDIAFAKQSLKISSNGLNINFLHIYYLSILEIVYLLSTYLIYLHIYLTNDFLKNRTAEDKLTYNHQRNYCVSLTYRSKSDYYNNLDNRNVTDNKLFWKSVEPFFSDKGPMRHRSYLLKMTTSLATIKKFLRFSTIFYRV